MTKILKSESDETAINRSIDKIKSLLDDSLFPKLYALAPILANTVGSRKIAYFDEYASMVSAIPLTCLSGNKATIRIHNTSFYQQDVESTWDHNLRVKDTLTTDSYEVSIIYERDVSYYVSEQSARYRLTFTILADGSLYRLHDVWFALDTINKENRVRIHSAYKQLLDIDKNITNIYRDIANYFIRMSDMNACLPSEDIIPTTMLSAIGGLFKSKMAEVDTLQLKTYVALLPTIKTIRNKLIPNLRRRTIDEETLTLVVDGMFTIRLNMMETYDENCGYLVILEMYDTNSDIEIYNLDLCMDTDREWDLDYIRSATVQAQPIIPRRIMASFCGCCTVSYEETNTPASEYSGQTVPIRRRLELSQKMHDLVPQIDTAIADFIKTYEWD